MGDPYEALAAALDRLPNGFPRTPSRVELRLLARLAAPEEAALAALMGREAEPFEVIAARAGLEPDTARRRLMEMAKRGLVWISKGGGRLRFRLAAFVYGLWESQVDRLDHDLVHLFEAYMRDGGAKGIMGPEPGIHRVLPAHGALKTVARDKVVIMTKTHASTEKEMWADLDRFRKEIGTDMLDIVLLHCMMSADWPKQKAGAMAVLSEAKAKGIIRAHGVSCHDFGALKAAAASDWVDVAAQPMRPGTRPVTSRAWRSSSQACVGGTPGRVGNWAARSWKEMEKRVPGPPGAGPGRSAAGRPGRGARRAPAGPSPPGGRPRGAPGAGPRAGRRRAPRHPPAPPPPGPGWRDEVGRRRSSSTRSARSAPCQANARGGDTAAVGSPG